MLSNKFLAEYKKLNPEQKQAIDEIEGPVMVIAGPGTGKTQILAMRIANILAKTQVNPANILALTFTNSGVQAMKERLLEIIGPPSYQVQVFTFHAFCNEVISQFPEKFLITKTINQLDDLEQIFIIQNILKNHQFKFIKPLKSPYYYQKAIIDTIGKLKQENITPQNLMLLIQKETQDFLRNKDLPKGKLEEHQNQLNKNRELYKVYQFYQNYLEKEGKYDYNDMILFVLNALRTDSELLNHYQEKYQYILIDEFQDTNSAQNEITKLLGSFYETPNIFVVGDDEQSIFRFQGASMENILTFQKDYPSVKTIVLQSNYRSGQNILNASRAVILQNKNQIFNRLNIPKNLKSQNKNIPGEIKLGKFTNGSIENYFIAREIQNLIKIKKINPSQIAVLFRENRDAAELIDFLSKLNIPYHLEIGESILNDPELSKLITFLKVLNIKDEIEDNQLVLEIMHYPFFKLLPLDIYKIVSAAFKQKKNIFTIITSDLNYLNLEKEKSIKDFLKLILQCRTICYNNTFSHALELIIDESGFLDYLLSITDNINHLNRLQTLFKYVQGINLKQKDLNLAKFLNHLSLLEENNLSIQEESIAAEFEGINLMTAHKSKGMEFEIVFIMRLIDKHWGNKQIRQLIKLPTNIFSTNIKHDPLSEDEEERRLFYVSLTRAKKIIYLTYAQSYGEKESETLAIPSKFIGELPIKDLKVIKTEVFEKQFDQKLKLRFKTKKWQQSKKMVEFLKAILLDFKLSPTALNTFLECPQRFFYDNILRVPKAKDFNQSYGTAIHFTLERFFKKYKKEMILPKKSELLIWFKEGLTNEILSQPDFIRALNSGSNVLKKYYDTYADVWKKRGVPISCEFNFGFHNVHFGNVPITGRIDKIELIDSISNKVRIIDYKTSAPKSLNQMLGLTKEKDLSLFYQAYFYKLLTESDPLFNWQVAEIVFDFISDRGFKQVVLPIDEKQYQEFKNLVQKTYQDISKLNFPKELKNCRKHQRKCSYLRICQNY